MVLPFPIPMPHSTIVRWLRRYLQNEKAKRKAKESDIECSSSENESNGE